MSRAAVLEVLVIVLFPQKHLPSQLNQRLFRVFEFSLHSRLVFSQGCDFLDVFLSRLSLLETLFELCERSLQFGDLSFCRRDVNVARFHRLFADLTRVSHFGFASFSQHVAFAFVCLPEMCA